MNCYPKSFKSREEYLSYRKEYYQNNKYQWVNWQKRDKEKIRKRHIEYFRVKVYSGNRKEVLKRDNYMCQICFGLSGFKKLIIHHKDNKGSTKPEKEQNNLLTNLVTLCNSCHSRLHHGKISLV